MKKCCVHQLMIAENDGGEIIDFGFTGYNNFQRAPRRDGNEARAAQSGSKNEK